MMVSGTYFRKGKCAECKGSAERTKTFSATSMEEVQKQADQWGDEPIRHKRCE